MQRCEHSHSAHPAEKLGWREARSNIGRGAMGPRTEGCKKLAGGRKSAVRHPASTIASLVAAAELGSGQSLADLPNGSGEAMAGCHHLIERTDQVVDVVRIDDQ